MGRPKEVDAKHTQRGQVRTDGLSTILFEQDTRTFQDVLFAWEKHEGRDGQEFLNKTGLSVVLNTNDFREIELGHKTPSERLARIMAMNLPGGVMRPNEPATFYPRLYGFQNRAKYWRKQNSTKPEIAISDDQFLGFCVHVLEGFRKAAQTSPVESAAPSEPVLPADSNTREKILGYLVKRSRNTKTAEEIGEILTAQYQESPKETVQGLQGLLKDSGFTYSEDELHDFLEAQTPDKQRPPQAQALAFLRQSRGMYQRELAEKLEVVQTTIDDWEHGNVNIDIYKLESLIEALSLSEKEAKRFILLVRPDIIENIGIDWLREKIVTKNWEHINFPAFDEVWLAAQPSKKQAGLLLDAYIESKGLSQVDLANKLGVSQSQISYWITGARSISPGKVNAIAKALNLTDNQQEHFKERVKIFQLSSLCAFDEVWLAAQLPRKQAGLLLAAHIRQEGLMIKDFADSLGIEEQTAYQWTSGSRNISSVEQIIKVLHLTDDQGLYLKMIIEKSRKAINEDRSFKRGINKANTQLGSTASTINASFLELLAQENPDKNVKGV